jgi:hypothetical protein
MNVVERQAVDFYKQYNREIKRNRFEKTQKVIEEKLLLFKRDREKLDFLRIIRPKFNDDLLNHKSICTDTSGDCFSENALRNVVFIIDQEIDNLNESYTYEVPSSERLSPEEESKLTDVINQILNSLNRLEHGQEIIFNEIDDLKSNYDLGKKKWYKLFFGTVSSAVVDKIIDETVAAKIVGILQDGISHFGILSE